MNILSSNNEKLNIKLRIAALVVLIILVSWPALFMDMAKGHDLNFHLMRIEGIMSDASWRNLPVRMQSKWVDGYGYPVSVLYGDLFLYIPAVFRKLGLPIMTAYRLFVLCINSATVIIGYNSFKAFYKGWPAVAATWLYTTAAYRLVDEYVRSAVGETLAITFFPAVAACIYCILTIEDHKKAWKYTAILALAFTAVICSHTLTTSMMLVVLAPCTIVCIFLFVKKKDRLIRFWQIVSAGLITLLLAGFFLLPFMDFYLNADIGFAIDKSVNIQGLGLVPADLFDFFENPFNTRSGDIQKTPGLALMAALVAAAVYIIVSLRKKGRSDDRRRIVFYFTVSVILLFMTSRFFPWDFIEHNIPFGGIFVAIEFPMRYLAFAILFMAILAGDLLNMLDIKAADRANAKLRTTVVCMYVLVAFLGVANVAHLAVCNHSWEKKAHFMKEEDLGRWDYYAMDFQLNNSTVNDLDPGIKTEGMLNFELLSRSSNDFMMACVTDQDFGWVQLPVFAYPYYYAEVVDDPSVSLEMHEGANRTVGVLLPGNFSGILHVYWKEPVLWRICDLISLLTAMVCIAFIAYTEYQSRAKKGKNE